MSCGSVSDAIALSNKPDVAVADNGFRALSTLAASCCKTAWLSGDGPPAAVAAATDARMDVTSSAIFSKLASQSEHMATTTRTGLNILVTGTPGTGKTTFSELLVAALGGAPYQTVNVSELVKTKGLHEGWVHTLTSSMMKPF